MFDMWVPTDGLPSSSSWRSVLGRISAEELWQRLESTIELGLQRCKTSQVLGSEPVRR